MLLRRSTNFILVPSEKEIEERLEKQIKDAWKIAVDKAQDFIKKIKPNHEVVIQFDKRLGFYKGNSLGIALTLSFIEELLRFYNSNTIIKVQDSIAITGGLDENGKVIPTSKKIIEKKVVGIFYSSINTFIVPIQDEVFAKNKLEELLKKYPGRNLNIIAVWDIEDVLDRRKIVEIKNLPVIKRTLRFGKRNWASLSLLILLAAVITFSGILDFDNNPAVLENVGKTLLVKNKNGKVLWTKEMKLDFKIGYEK